MAKKNTALATMDSFRLVDRYAGLDQELLEELRDQMDDLDQDDGIDCRKIKVPSGGQLAYVVQGEDDGDEEYMKEVRGVVLFTHRLNAYWANSFGSESSSKAPDCSSIDGKSGITAETGEVRTCETCPYNQYGSAIDQNGQQGRGKACKNMRRIYLMMDGDPNVYLLTVPPTSIRDVNKQMKKIIAAGTPYTGMVTSLTLERVKNAGGTEYAKVVIARAGLLPPAIAAQALALRRQIKAQYENISITLDDYNTAPSGGNGGFRPAGRPVDVSAEDWYDGAPPHGDEDLPFA